MSADVSLLPNILKVFEISLPLLYASALGLHGYHFLREDSATSAGERGNMADWAARLTWLTLSVHAAYLAARGLAHHAWPFTSKAEFLSWLALAITVIHASAERKERVRHTGIFFLGIAFPFQLGASVLMEPPTTHPILLEHPVYGVHVAFTLMGFAALAVGALYAMMFILLSRQLKARALGLIFRRLPPLVKLEGFSKASTVAGIFLLGAGLCTGHFVAIYSVGSYSPWDPKVIITDLAWVGYLVALFVIKVRGLSGLRIAYMSLVAYAALMGAMIASSLLTTAHSFQ